jgi:hypothetical protein
MMNNFTQNGKGLKKSLCRFSFVVKKCEKPLDL